MDVVASLTAETEIALVLKAQDGDRGAFEELVRQNYTFITNIIYRMCNDMALAEDAAQEAFLRAWMKLPSYQPNSPLRNWLCRIGVNAALDMLRRRREDPLDGQVLRMVDNDSPGPEASLIEKETAATLQNAIQQLPDGTRSVLVLREYGDLSYQEISVVLEVPIGTVMSRLNSARSRLRELVKKELHVTEIEYA